jgi:hypothetical protein
MPGRRSAVLGLTASDASDLLFDHSVTIDLLHVIKLEPLDTPSATTNGAS